MNPEDTTPKKTRAIEEIYAETHPVDDFHQVCLSTIEESDNFEEVVSHEEWRQAIQEEYVSILRNQTWDLVPLPPGKKPIGLRWVFKLKKNSNGEIARYKARLVAKGYVQKAGIDYDEVFAPVARMDTVRMLIALAALNSWFVHHLDVKSAFLNEDLEETVYVKQPEGYIQEGKEHLVLNLKKALYGLTQAPRAWNLKLDSCLKSMGFMRCEQDHAVYVQRSSNCILIIGVYVDDLLITGSHEDMILAFKGHMGKLFEMSDLGLLTTYLGLEITQEPTRIKLGQRGYAMKILLDSGMENCNLVLTPLEARSKFSKEGSKSTVDSTTYRSYLGRLRYLTHTRPDLVYSIGILCRYMEQPTTEHWAGLKRVLRYVNGTVNLGLIYDKKQKSEESLTGYSDSDYAGDLNDRKSTSSMVFFLGNMPISWNSQKQSIVSLSSCEAEYIAVTSAACQGIWLSRLQAELTNKENKVVKLRVDNRSAIALCKNLVFHGRSKHIETRFHMIRDLVVQKTVEVSHVASEDQLADVFTKALGKVKFIELRRRIGLHCFDAEMQVQGGD